MFLESGECVHYILIPSIPWTFLLHTLCLLQAHSKHATKIFVLLLNHIYAFFCLGRVLRSIFKVCIFYMFCMLFIPLVHAGAHSKYSICLHHFPAPILQTLQLSLNMRSVHHLSTPRASYHTCLMHAPFTPFARPKHILCTPQAHP